jgi:ubiquinone/menaquinone biosynthesis C-methylase UbiE
VEPLKRTLEPEVMDTDDDAREYNRMDHSEVNVRFVDEYIAFLDSNGKHLGPLDVNELEESQSETNRIADILDPGTGTALIPIELCKRTPEVRLMAIDMAVSMLDLAVYNLEVAGIRGRVTLAQVDAKDMGYEDSMFDSVMSNSIVHHIPEPQTVLKEIDRVTRAGGVVFVRDLMRPDSAETVDEIVKTYAGQESDYSRRLFKESLHASLSIDEIKAMVADLGYDPGTVTATSDRHWTWAAVKEPLETS